MHVTLAHGVAAVAGRILELARLIVGGKLQSPLRVILDRCGDDRLVVDGCIEAAVLKVLRHLDPGLVTLVGDARRLLDPFGIVGAEQGAAGLSLQVRDGRILAGATLVRQPFGIIIGGKGEIDDLGSGDGVVDRIADDIEAPVQQAGNHAVERHRVDDDLVDLHHLGSEVQNIRVDAAELVGLGIEVGIRPVVRRAELDFALFLDLYEGIVGLEFGNREVLEGRVERRRGGRRNGGNAKRHAGAHGAARSQHRATREARRYQSICYFGHGYSPFYDILFAGLEVSLQAAGSSV